MLPSACFLCRCFWDTKVPRGSSWRECVGFGEMKRHFLWCLDQVSSWLSCTRPFFSSLLGEQLDCFSLLITSMFHLSLAIMSRHCSCRSDAGARFDDTWTAHARPDDAKRVSQHPSSRWWSPPTWHVTDVRKSNWTSCSSSSSEWHV